MVCRIGRDRPDFFHARVLPIAGLAHAIVEGGGDLGARANAQKALHPGQVPAEVNHGSPLSISPHNATSVDYVLQSLGKGTTRGCSNGQVFKFRVQVMVQWLKLKSKRVA